MSDLHAQELFARLLHRRSAKLQPGDSVTPSITPAAVFHLPGQTANAPYQYGRYHNPTWDELEAALSILEDAETIALPSGMAAVAGVCFSLLRSGDRVLMPSDGYHATRALARDFLAPLGVEVDTRPTARMLDGGLSGYRLVLAETPCNPALDVCDVAALAAAAHAAGATLAVDNTTVSALGQRPLDLGADLVICAGTKVINGHSDVLSGHIATRDTALMHRLREWRKLSGSIPGPFETWLVYRGLETLEVRYERMCANASALAERLAGHSKLTAIRFPGLRNDPAHAVACRQMSRYGFLISLTFADATAAERFINGCPLIQPSTSFGGVRTSAERRARWGDATPEGFVRLAVGIEPLEPLWAAIEAALAAI